MTESESVSFHPDRSRRKASRGPIVNVFNAFKKMASAKDPQGSRVKVAPGSNELVIKYLTQINASVAKIDGEVSSLREEVAAVKVDVNKVLEASAKQNTALFKAREEDVRYLTSRVATIGTHVSYMRQNVCTNVLKAVSTLLLNTFLQRCGIFPICLLQISRRETSSMASTVSLSTWTRRARRRSLSSAT